MMDRILIRIARMNWMRRIKNIGETQCRKY